MSIELLPPDKKYPKKFHVRVNYCKCHPETCCCNDWAVFDPNGKKHSTFFAEDTAHEVADALNLKVGS
jgi:hypothetical protein